MSREFKSIKELNEYLSSIKDGVNHRLIPQVLSLAGNTLKNIIETSFVEQKSPSGVSFAPLKKNTKLKKLRSGKSSKILRSDGDLEDNWVISKSKNKVKVFNNSKSDSGFSYGIVHQFGSAKNNIPARPFLPLDANNNLDQQVQNEIIKIVNDELTKLF